MFHKRDFFDNVDDFKNQKQSFEKQLEHEKKKYSQYLETIKKDLDAVQMIIESLNQKLDQIKEGNEAFESLNGSDC